MWHSLHTFLKIKIIKSSLLHNICIMKLSTIKVTMYVIHTYEINFTLLRVDYSRFAHTQKSCPSTIMVGRENISRVIYYFGYKI